MKQILTIFIILLAFISGQKTSDEIQSEIEAQSNSLEKLRREIELVERRILQKENETRNAEEILSDLNQKIDLTEKLIRSLTREERLYNERIEQAQQGITQKSNELSKLKDQMRTRVIYLYQYGNPSLLETIFYSRNWNDMVYRIKYLEILKDREGVLSNSIETTIIDLETENVKYEKELADKKKLREEKEREIKNLQSDIHRRNEYLATVQSERAVLQGKLSQKQAQFHAMEEMIEKLLNDKQAAKIREEELIRMRALQNMATTGNFSTLRGKLPWPVTGKVISHFGMRKNAQLNTITENPGIDISAPAGTEVSSVLDGIVTKITFLRGFGNVIIVDHGGGYQTVYAHVDQIRVSEKEYISAGSIIAEIAKNGSEPEELHFEIYGNNEKLDPEKWLVKK
ncbi:MAG: peptidoglycan DD-metalloendopeptidase family protein [Candidatus Marinimicrobia bacterium]|nr:peptidoglycan DD-metalloendopeptidase family protein [Candidatus Neomarinimicrobiota bacterium]